MSGLITDPKVLQNRKSTLKTRYANIDRQLTKEITIVGHSAVGKTTLINILSGGEFKENINRTINCPDIPQKVTSFINTS